MKSLKKTLVLLVVFSMILSAVMPAFAATDIYGLDCEEEVARLEALKVVTGYEDGTFGPEKTITRAEMAVILCKMVGIDTVTVDENKNVPSKFSDVAAGEWYTGYINVAAGKGLLSGFPDGTFRPSEQLTMNQVLTLCVNALGRGEYVAEMGTWPANYIAEATKLGLLDGVKTSDANRGNVAIIVWNTLEAPYVWDVTNTEYEGSINLGNSTRSLLSIYFRDYVYTDTDTEKEYFKEATVVTVAAAPSMDKDLGSRQIVLDPTDSKEFVKFEDDFETSAPRKNEEEATWFKDGKITAYVPEEVCKDLEALYGKEVTVIFGEDNVVVAITVTNDAFVDNEFIENIDIANDKITIASTSYKYTKDTEVYVNGVAFGKGEDQIKAVLTAIGVEKIDSTRSLTKVVKANVILNNKNKIERIDMTISGEYSIDSENGEIVNESTFLANKASIIKLLDDATAAVNELAGDGDNLTSAIVTKLGSAVTSITAFNSEIDLDIDTTDLEGLDTSKTKADVGTIITNARSAVSAATADIEPTHKIAQRIVEDIKKKGDVMAVGYPTKLYNFEDLIEEEAEPKVVKAGAEIALDEIAEGDVLTLVYEVESPNETIRTIYVSSEKVEGEIANINRDLSFKVGGTRYYANYNALFTTSGELDEIENDDTVNYVALKDIDGEEATVYLNILGEYVAVVTESTSTDGVFAVVKKVYDLDEDADDEEFIKISVMLADGTSTKYTIKYSDKADKTTGATESTLNAINEHPEHILNKLIRAKVNSDNVIMIDDLEIAEEGTVGKIDGTDVKVVKLPTTSTIEYDDKIITDGTADIEYDFAKADFLNYDDTTDAEKWEVVKWKSLIAKGNATINTSKLNANSLYVVEDSTAKILDVKLVVNTTSSFASTGAEYGVVTNVENKTTGKENITLYTKNGEVTYEVATADVELDAGRIECGDFVLFEASNGKIVSGKLSRVIDVVDLNSIDDLALADAIGFEVKYDGTNKAVATEKVANTTKDHLVVKYDADYTNRLFYEKSGDIELSYVRLNKDGVTIFDLSEMNQYGEGATTLKDISELDGRKVIAIDSDSETGAEILVVIAD